MVGNVLPAFGVISNAFLTDTLQLICHGGAEIIGDVLVDLEPGGAEDPSVAIFNNISFTKCNLYSFIFNSILILFAFKPANFSLK